MQFHLGLFLFLLGGAIAQLVCPDVPATGCNVCPPGECITNLDAIFVNPIDATVTVPCGDLQQGGLDGGIDPVTECPFLPGLITVCECMPKGSPTGAPDDPSTGLETLEPIDVIDPTDAPVGPPVLDVPLADPTPAPVVVPTDAPVIGPTDAPVNGPTDAPIIVPTDAPVIGPTDAPVNGPTDAPVVVPTDAPIAPTPMPTDVIVPDGAPSAEPTTDDSEQEPSTAPNPNFQTVYPVFAPPTPSGGKLLVILLYPYCCLNTSSC